MGILVLILILNILWWEIPPHYGLLLGLFFTLTSGVSAKVKAHCASYSKVLLQICIIFLGAKLNINTLLSVGKTGLLLTSLSIVFVFMLGFFFAKIFNVKKNMATLISSGTSICGGSAISSVSPVINAKSFEMAAALGVVFILNTLAIFIFPPMAKFLQMSQAQFGTWAALAIHDTSSVVAATQLYGDEALSIGTTLKLVRSLWIIPLVLFISIQQGEKGKLRIPGFIIGFLIFSLLFSFVADLQFLIPYLSALAKSGLSVVLFLIGLTLSLDNIKSIGIRPFAFALSLWVATIIVSYSLVVWFI